MPNPRIYKRMKLAKGTFNISVIYWKRSFNSYNTFFEDSDITKHEVIGSEEYKAYGLSVYKRILLILKFMFRALKIMKKNKPDIIHCEHLDMLFIAYFYKKFYKQDVRIVYEVADLHGIVYNTSKKPSRKILRKFFISIEKRLCTKVEKLIITSPYFWADYYNDLISKEDVLFIPNAPEKRVFKDVSTETNSKFTIGFIGAVRYSKQLKMLIDLANETKAFNVLIAGNGSAYEGIKEYSKNMDFVNVYGAYDYEKEISDLYSKVDVIYSVYDTKFKNVMVALPNRLYEAIVSEKPIIASRNTKLGEFIENNEIGFLVNDKENSELKILLHELINNDRNIMDRTKENCKKIKEEYYMDYYNSKIIDLYESLKVH